MKKAFALVCMVAALSIAAFAQLCDFPNPQGVDMGNLNECYPTLSNNPGHALTGVAWLGPQVTGEAVPYSAADASRDCFGFGRDALSLDPGTDGVAFFGAPWMPCTQVAVAVLVTGGPNYAAWADNPDHHLYLSAWKNGDYPNDSDFDDELCGGAASEWLIHDAIVTPSPIPYLFNFMDPGVFNHGVYRGVFRFRLGSHPFGRYGYGYNPGGSPNCPANMANDINGGFDCVGEVEDYDMCDFQLAVELQGFDATPGNTGITLTWNTASESQNDHFNIVRDGVIVATVQGQGHSSTNQSYSYTDNNNVVNGTTYHYSLEGVDVNGHRQELATATATASYSSAAVTEYALTQNYPNPFNPTTSISFDLKENTFVSLRVYNMIGQEVATLVNGNLTQGRHAVSFDATNLPSGLYVYRMEAGSFTATKKMLLMK